MTPTGKTQPQKLLEEIIPHDENEKYPGNPASLEEQLTAAVIGSEFPSIEEQKAYWDDKEKAAEPTPQVRFCPNCGCGLERFLS